MKTRLLLALLAAAPLLPAADTAASDSGWPEITRENKPWTRWWWPGSAVDKASLTAQLEKFAAAGLGGVEITPIYGAKGYEERYIDFLSPKWMEMLEHVGREAQRLGLGVDMATGTGWPFGGPWITPEFANTRAVLRDGRIVGEPTRQMVKRAAPGDEGLVVDPFSPEALRRYLAPFDKAFANFPAGLVRGQFHDSFEYYGASWTADFAKVFQEMHGYDVQQFAAALLAKPGTATGVDADTLGRVKSDYRETLARLHLDYLRTWVEWSHARGFKVRNQSHGAPGNLLDLYANADIPETEIFGSTPFPLPGLRRDHLDVRGGLDLPESLVIRMASSAAHVAGRPLASSESLTWLREHFRESPSHMKPELDRIFADGINHVFYHGTVFSPTDAPWPGWLFYASTQFNPNNPLWDDLAALNRYVARVQSVLQRGTPDNDILVYWPFYDLLDDHAAPLARQFTVHDVKWLTEQPVGKVARHLLNKGYGFEFISDAQIQKASCGFAGFIRTQGGTYRTIIIPPTRRMPLETFQRLLEFAQDGAWIEFFGQLPDDVPGYGRLETRRAAFQKARSDLAFSDDNPAWREARIGQGRMIVEKNFESSFRIEAWLEGRVPNPLRAITRRMPDGYFGFFANSTENVVETLVAGRGLTRDSSAIIMDPNTGEIGVAPLTDWKKGGFGVFLQLRPGESLLVRTFDKRKVAGVPWRYTRPAGEPVTLAGKWSITFLQGGPALPPAIETAALKSWTELGGEDAQRFAGTARYRLEFEAPTAKADDWRLDLGDVRETARVRLNGKEVGTAWCLPFQLRVGEFLKPGRNILEIDVTNLAANRIRDLDKRGVAWRIMREINFVNINYQPFDASSWDLTPSGLLGPVRLVPLKAFTPQ
jgi:hypothetical protein